MRSRGLLPRIRLMLANGVHFVWFVLRQKELGGQSVDSVRFSFQIGSAALISGLFLFLDLFLFFYDHIRVTDCMVCDENK